VRTVANTLARAINPGRASAQLIGVAHPAYIRTHQDVALRLGQHTLAVLKGGGGEVQRNPLKASRVGVVVGGEAAEWEFSALLADDDHDWRREPLDPDRIAALWRADDTETAPAAAVVATAAVALRVLGKAETAPAADAMAAEMWRRRDRRRIGPGLRLSA